MTKSTLCVILVTALQRYSVTALQRYSVTALQRYHLLIFNTLPAPRFHGGSKRANALYCFHFTWFYKHLVSKKLKIQSSDNASYVRAEGEDFCGTLRLDPKNIPLPLFNFKLHLSTVSLISNWLECASSIIEKNTLWVRTRFELGFPLCNQAYKSFFRQLSFLRTLSFLHSLLSFPRRRESSMYFVSLTAIKLWVQGVCQKKHPLGARRRESRKSLFSEKSKLYGVKGNFLEGRSAWTLKKSPLTPLKYLLLTFNIKVRLLYA